MKRTTLSERALVLAPMGRDAAIAVAMLAEAGIDATTCASLAAVVEALNGGAAFVVVTEEALAASDLAPLAAWLADQEEWSDLPFVLLTNRGGGLERNPAARRYLDVLGNVTFLERPFHPTTLVSLARSALRNRRRQYDARARLVSLRAGEERYRSLFEAIDAGFCVIELKFDPADGAALDYRFLEVNPAFERLTGLANVHGQWMREIAPDHEQQWFDYYGDVARTGHAIRFEERAEALGRYFDVHALRVGAANQNRVAVLFNDITARREMEQRLRESEERLRQATEAAEVGFSDVDLVNGVLNWPPRVKAMFGISADAPVTMQEVIAAIHPDDRQRAIEAYAAAADPARRALYDVEYRTIGKEDGLIRWVAAKGRGLFDEDGRCVRVIGTAIDVTERKRAEASLRDLMENLELRVEEEVAERAKAEEQLRQAQKMEALGKLTGGVAHDFNNLLSPITGALDMLQRRYGQDDERAAKLLGGALQSAERAKGLVQRLLGFARQQALETSVVDLSALLDGMRDLIASSIGATIELRIESRGDPPPALVDPNQLELALLNLCVNARDAMPEGGTLSILVERAAIGPRTRLELPPGPYVRLSVGDTGSGMDESTMRRAAEPFFSTKEQGKGTGLGLSMVSGLMGQLGGTMELSSALGRGTRIDLYFPAAEAAVEDRRLAPRRSADVLEGRALNVLLIDDEALVRAGTAEMLRELGHAVTEAGGGQQALELLEQGLPVDAVVTDYKMPRMDGAALAQRVRAVRPSVPILIVSGYAGGAATGLEWPMLAKPFRQGDLAAALDALFADEKILRYGGRTSA